MPMILKSYVCGQWHQAETGCLDIVSAVDGRTLARASTDGIDFAAVVAHARLIGGPSLRALTFHERADGLKALATYLRTRKEALYDLAYDTGATKRDSAADIDCGLALLADYADWAKTTLPNARAFVDGDIDGPWHEGGLARSEMMSPLPGVTVAVNAFNCPVVGLLGKLAPAILAGMPVIVKPATATAQVAEALASQIVASSTLPAGSFQFIAGDMGNLLDHLCGEDVVAVTGSTPTSERIANHPVVLAHAVRVIAQRESLNAAILAPDAEEGTPEFDLFINAVARSMTLRAGQTATAIRRIIVPREREGDVAGHIAALLGKVTVGDPRADATGMGPLATVTERDKVLGVIEDLVTEADIVFGDPEHGHSPGAYFSPVLLRARDPKSATKVHSREAFGPVATILTYDSIEDAISLTAQAGSSLLAAVFTGDAAFADQLVSGIAPYSGHVLVLDGDCALETLGSTVAMAGLRGLLPYLQRTTVRASPARLAQLTETRRT